MLVADTCKCQKGSILLESLIAILVFSFGILGIVGLQASSIKATTQSKQRIDASLVANQQIANMWLDRTNLASFVESNTILASLAESDTSTTSLPNGKRTTAVVGDQVTVTVSWQLPGESTASTFTAIAKINGN